MASHKIFMWPIPPACSKRVNSGLLSVSLSHKPAPPVFQLNSISSHSTIYGSSIKTREIINRYEIIPVWQYLRDKKDSCATPRQYLKGFEF